MGNDLNLDGEFSNETPNNPAGLGSVMLPEPVVYEKCEWCFQFDDDEPYVFAAVGNPKEPSETPKVTFTINNTSDSNIIFTYNGKTFKLFARELTESGQKLINNE